MLAEGASFWRIHSTDNNSWFLHNLHLVWYQRSWSSIALFYITWSIKTFSTCTFLTANKIKFHKTPYYCMSLKTGDHHKKINKKNIVYLKSIIYFYWWKAPIKYGQLISRHVKIAKLISKEYSLIPVQLAHHTTLAHH